MSESFILAAMLAAIVIAPFKALATPTNSSVNILLSQQIALGTTAKAKLITPIVWSPSYSTLEGPSLLGLPENSELNETRGVITLSEPIFCSNGVIAISEGSSLIVEVTSWERSGLVSLSAISMAHDARGKLPQQAIPPGTLLIKAKNNKPLIAKTQHSNDNNSEVLDVLNDVATTATNGLSREIRALFRPKRRNRPSSQELIYQIEADTEVSVFVQGTPPLKGSACLDFVNNSLDI